MSTKKDKFSDKDKNFMRIAINLAKARKGLTGDNPSVGCVIVKNNKIISIGQTGYNGRPHAETNAINNSFQNLKGSKMYVTLEPCNHYGKTPPCTKSIIRSGIDEVFYSINDLDNKVKGKSFNILSKKKIKVKKGLLKNDAINLYDSYLINRNLQLPYVTAKIAISKNKLIYSEGIKRITNQISDKLSHYLRFKNDAIMISVKTLNIDNPKLDCRLKGYEKFSPIRIILDNKLKTNTNSYLFKTANKENTIFFYNEAIKSKILEFKKNKITVLKSNIDNNKRFNPSIILKKLYTLGCRNVLVEGGDELTKNFVSNKIFNQFFLFKISKDLSKSFEFKEFSGLKILKKNYKKRLKINSNFGKDTITLYKN